MGYITILLFLIVIILTVRLFILRSQINRITNNLRNIIAGRGHGKLTVMTLHKPLEDLCQQISYGLENINQTRIDAENHEAELRTQIANLSHDLRTPLTAILGYVYMLRSRPDKTTDYLEIIENRVKLLQTLVEQFYELSVIEDYNTELSLEPVDVTAISTNCLLGNITLFENKGIQPQAYLPERAVMVMSNSQALERIFQNLIHNSIKFANCEISISLTDEKTHCVFTISNDAPNLVETDIPYLFKKFYTANKSRTDGNIGLGLNIVERLLTKTKGSISSVVLKEGRLTLEICFYKQ